MDIRIIRSKKRSRTVQAREVDGVLEILAPARMTDKELAPFITSFKERIQRRKQKNTLDDRTLEERAGELNRLYFGGRLRWTAVRWVANQQKRWGSCSPANGAIRLSSRLAGMPRFVQDYVLMHEMAHLEEANHGNRFWDLVYRYPLTERARGYLMAAGLEEVTEE